MIDGRAQAVPMHAFGKRYTTHDIYADYRPEGGVMMAHSDKEIDSSTGAILDEGGITAVKINPDLPSDAFAPPIWKRTPLQQMVQRIYDERYEQIAVLRTYRDLPNLVDMPR